MSELTERLRELVTAITEGREAVLREFTMRVPAEPERDADLVISTAADEIERLTKQRDELLASASEVVRISDRKHDAWDRLKAAIANVEKS